MKYVLGLENSSKYLIRFILLFLILSFYTGISLIHSQENADCLTCHEDKDLEGVKKGKTISVFVNEIKYKKSVHSDMECIECHTDLKGTDGDHKEELKKVSCISCHDDVADSFSKSVHNIIFNERGCASCHDYHYIISPSEAASKSNPVRSKFMCGKCHKTVAEQHKKSLHGRAQDKGDKLAPNCVSCHGSHEILSHTDKKSPTSIMNIPLLCGKCHHEGTEVSIKHDIPQDKILENYSQSIHGVGLFKQGLTVTAVCTSCHTSHEILEHTNPESSIHRDKVAETCTQCHAKIEEVHDKIIEGKHWKTNKKVIPSCVECHSPHKIIRKNELKTGAANRNCFSCHFDKNLKRTVDGKDQSLFVDKKQFNLSIHANTACAQCHTDVQPNKERPCETVKKKVDCSVCHAETVKEHKSSVHGKFAAEGDKDAPTCLDCHDNHYSLSHKSPLSPTFASNIPKLCARCHRAGEKAAKRIKSEIPDIIGSFEMSIHGKGLLESGLVVSASCPDCHSSHKILPASDPASSINNKNISNTCGQCHYGIENTFKMSVHFGGNTKTDKKLPTCESCHTSHTISRTDAKGFRNKMMNQCGNCHKDEAKTFFDTYHGKVSRLGADGSAKCYDCHGTHDILRMEDPKSHLSRNNVVETCGKCHPGSHKQFTGYLTHATHHDPDKYPYLFYSFWFMTLLLISVLSFFMLHTILWLYRLWRTKEEWKHHKHQPGQKLYRRFSQKQRIMHLILLTTFLLLAITGMALKFSYAGWAQVISSIFGGFAAMGTIHRIAALTQVGMFIAHLLAVRKMKKNSGKSWIKFIFAPDSMMFNINDIRQFFAQVKWFIGKGERPEFGRFTYWEKFDYFAVFWGIIIIGSSGLILWFPELFTRILPGWSINMATIIHSDEALLAAGFIFTIHFFNTHFRPDKFPIDPVIFTGRMTLEELKLDKPGEYKALIDKYGEEGVKDILVDPVPEKVEQSYKAFGFIALGLGVGLIFLIIYAMII